MIDIHHCVFMFWDNISPRGKCSFRILNNNTASLNLSKLELSYSVDPLFHKMSKKFDEGGAKGLLLVNLGVSSDSYTILFDSKEEKEKSLIADDANARSREIPTDANESDDVNTSKIVSSPSTVAETLDEEIEKGRHVNPVGCNAQGKVVKSTDEVDITGLVAQLDGLLNGQSLETMQLVPQLEMMRNTLGKLEEEGFTNNLVPKTPKVRFDIFNSSAKIYFSCTFKFLLTLTAILT